MPSKDYLPGREAALVTWTDRFLAAITAAPADFGLTAPDATNYQTSRTRFVDLYLQAQGDATRTRVVVNEKNVAKRTLINATRTLVRVCEAWPQMTNAKRLELGITERKPRAGSVPAPTTEPFVKVESVIGRRVTVSLQASRTRRDRPAGADSANLFVAYGPAAPADVDGWQLYTGTNRSRVVLTLDKSDAATKAWVCACWLNRRREAGPACAPTGVDLAAVSVVPQPMAAKAKKAA